MSTRSPFQPTSPRTVRLKIALALFLVGFFLALGTASWYVVQHAPLDIDFSTSSLEALVKRWGVWGPLVSMLLMVVHAFVPFPAEAIAIANGMLFGLWYGTLLTWCGAMIGAGLSYGLARWLGQQALRHLVPARHWPTIERWSGAVDAGSWLLVRLIPVISFNLINYTAGLANVRFRTFLWTTGLGILPLTLISVLLGHRLMGWPRYAWGALAAVAVVALWIMRVLRHRLRARDPSGHGQSCREDE